MTPRRELFALFAFALLLRGISAVRTVVMFDDGPLFLQTAVQLAAGDWAEALAHPYHPLYAAAVALLHAFGATPLLAALTVSCVAGALAVVAFTVFLRAAFDGRTARIGGSLLAMLPYAVIYSSDVQSEGLYMALFLGAVAALWHALSRHGALRHALLAGALSGLAYLTRPEGLGVVGVGGVLAASLALLGRASPARMLRCSAGLVLGAALFVAPYVVALHEVTGGWTLTQKKSVEAMMMPKPEALPDAARVLVPRTRPAIAAGSLLAARRPPPATLQPARMHAARPLPAKVQPPGSRASPLDAVRWIGTGFVSLFRSLLLVILVLGLWQCRGRPGTRGLFIGAFLLAYGLVLSALVLGYGYVARRHVLPPATLLLGYVALGVPVLGRPLAPIVQRLSRIGPRRAASIAGVALCALFLLPKTLSPHRANRLAERRAAEWIAREFGPGAAVASPKRRAVYYAQARHIYMWPGEVGSGVPRLRSDGARLLLIEEEKFALYPWLEQERGRSLRERHREEARGQVAFVYEISPAP